MQLPVDCLDLSVERGALRHPGSMIIHSHGFVNIHPASHGELMSLSDRTYAKIEVRDYGDED